MRKNDHLLREQLRQHRLLMRNSAGKIVPQPVKSPAQERALRVGQKPEAVRKLEQRDGVERIFYPAWKIWGKVEPSKPESVRGEG